MLGAIAGDMIGSRFEFSNLKSKEFNLWEDICTYTDDSVCTIALAEHYLTGENWADVLRSRCHSELQRGYGGMFLNWVTTPTMGPYDSWGNGGAMRTSPVAYIAKSEQDVLDHAEAQCAITHSHPDGIKGAQAIAMATYHALNGVSIANIAADIETRFEYDLSVPIDEVRPTYLFDVSAKGSVPHAIRAVMEADSFEDTIRNAISIGGDSDTIAAMAGSIAEPIWGITKDIWAETMSRLPAEYRQIVDDFYAKYANGPE